jgi:hypothetical protein
MLIKNRESFKIPFTTWRFRNWTWVTCRLALRVQTKIKWFPRVTNISRYQQETHVTCTPLSKKWGGFNFTINHNLKQNPERALPNHPLSKWSTFLQLAHPHRWKSSSRWSKLNQWVIKWTKDQIMLRPTGTNLSQS